MAEDEINKYKIENGIASSPDYCKWGAVRETFAKLKPGQSFLVPYNNFPRRSQNAMSVMASALRRCVGQYVVRATEDGIRIWRKEDPHGRK